MSHTLAVSEIAGRCSPEVRHSIRLILKHGTPGQVAAVRGVLKTFLHINSFPNKEIGPWQHKIYILERNKVHQSGSWVAKVRSTSRCIVLHGKQYPHCVANTTRLFKCEKVSVPARITLQHKTRSQGGVEKAFITMRRVKVAHGMDPTQRAGQTKESNEREAAMYGRSSQVIRSEKNRGKASFFKLLLNLLFTLIFPMMLQGDIVIECILKGLEQQYKEKHSRHSRSSHAASIVR